MYCTLTRTLIYIDLLCRLLCRLTGTEGGGLVSEKRSGGVREYKMGRGGEVRNFFYGIALITVRDKHCKNISNIFFHYLDECQRRDMVVHCSSGTITKHNLGFLADDLGTKCTSCSNVNRCRGKV